MTPPDTSSLVILGESLAAGLVNFSLQADDQKQAFPQRVAQQLGVGLRQPLFQPPGVGEACGFPSLPDLLPAAEQTTVLTELPSAASFGNLAVPGLTVAESAGRRPAAPLIHRDDPRQTAINFVLGLPGLVHGGASTLPTQLEYALGRRPTLAIVELGFAEAMEAAVAGRADLLPADGTFREHYGRIVSSLRRAGSIVVVSTIPDPMDTAYFSSLDAASRVLHMPVAELRRDYGLGADDRVLVNGLTAIGVQIMARRVAPLPPGSTLDGGKAAAVTARVRALNAIVNDIAREHGAGVADFAAVYRGVRTSGLRAGDRTLGADFLGGFFSLNGYTPGATGQAALANAVIDALNATTGQRVQTIDLAGVVAADVVADYRPAEGPAFRTGAGRLAAAGATLRLVAFLLGFVAKAAAGAITRKKPSRSAESGNDPSRWTLRLPPGMVQVLPIESRASYYGDALRPVHSTDPAEVALGLTGKLLFRGLALLDSHLHGKVRIRFFPPVDDITHFEVTHPGGGLSADDGMLSAPVFFRLAAVQHKVMDSTSEISSGDLNLVTGEVTNLRYKLFFLNSAILALAAVNPTLPKDPLAFPGEFGSTWARFHQRPDGTLDYTCYGTSFVPLSVLKTAIRFPLPFTSPSGSVASIPGDGTALHPHFHISTKALETRSGGALAAAPANTIREIATPAGRWQLQFGEHFGGTVSIAVQPLPPAGALEQRAPAAPRDPGADDRLNLPVGAMDLNTGRFMPDGGSRLPALRWDGASIVVEDPVRAVSGV